jgi:adenosylcobinamide-phosphate synthase
MGTTLTTLVLALGPLVAGWSLDLLLGDPARLPHPVVGFGRLISSGERWLNRGAHRVAKGGVLAVGLVAATGGAVWGLRVGLTHISPWLWAAAATILIFYSLAGTTLIREVREVFRALDRSLDQGRAQVARIVGRDTSGLSAHQVRTAALETLAENLNDGVVAPLFWLAVGGVPAMVAYKMVNTLDSMIGYRTERYAEFGRVAARLDDAAGWIPARLTALLMVALAPRSTRPDDATHPDGATRRDLWRSVRRFGPAHSSPNSGWPEAALAGALDCRFGGPHDYFGRRVDKPWIGLRDRPLTTRDMRIAIAINRRVELAALLLVAVAMLLKA